MTYRIRVSKQAARQIRAAADWWIENRPKARLAFSEDLEEAFQVIRTFPSIGEPVPHGRLHGVRRVHLGRVHYHLYYLISSKAEMVEVLALWHTSRGARPSLS